MERDEWIVTHTETLPNGNIRLRGVHPGRGPFNVTVTLEEYATNGPYTAVRAFYDHHPADLEARR